jgi:uncharacterized protein YndB with AHSA1/START domain
MAWLRMNRTITIAATPSQVWEVIADPERYASLDERYRLLGVAGEPGTVGSTFTIEVTRGERAFPLRYVVAAVVPDQLYAVDIHVRDRLSGRQEARLADDADGTRLRWSIESSVPMGLGWLARRTVGTELTKFMTQVQRAAQPRTAP